MNYDTRTKLIFEFLILAPDGLLLRYKRPEHLTDDAARAEINDMVEDVNREIPSDMKPEKLSQLMDGIRQSVRKRHGSRSWPAIKVLIQSTQDAIRVNRDMEYIHGGAEPEYIYGMVRDWWDRHHGPMPSTAGEQHSRRLVEEGHATWGELRRASFPIPDDELNKILKRGRYRVEIPDKRRVDNYRG